MAIKSKAKIKPKEVRFFRLSDSMWKKIQEEATVREMTASEYVRRIIETHLAADAKAR